MSNNFHQVLQQAQVFMQKMGDQFVTTEHLLLAILSNSTEKVSQLLEQFGINLHTAQEFISQNRKGEKITSQDPESTLDSLNKFAVNITQKAEQ